MPRNSNRRFIFIDSGKIINRWDLWVYCNESCWWNDSIREKKNCFFCLHCSIAVRLKHSNSERKKNTEFVDDCVLRWMTHDIIYAWLTIETILFFSLGIYPTNSETIDLGRPVHLVRDYSVEIILYIWIKRIILFPFNWTMWFGLK